MANFLRRLVSKSRSSSPQKGGQQQSGNATGLPPAYPHQLGEDDQDDWLGPAGPSPSMANHVPKTATATTGSSNRQGQRHSPSRHPLVPDQLGPFHSSHAHGQGPSLYSSPYKEGGGELPMNSLAAAKALPNHVGLQHRPPLSPSSNRRSPPTGRASKAPQSPASIRRQLHQFSFDEPGTSSQEILSSPSLWSPGSPVLSHQQKEQQYPWALRNSHSQPGSAGSSSQRPSSTQAGLMTRLDELSSAQTLGPWPGYKQQQQVIKEQQRPAAYQNQQEQPQQQQQQRPRSSSPRKGVGGGIAGNHREAATSPEGSRSRSPPKKAAAGKRPTATAKTLDYLQAQCRLEGCSATILVEDTRFLVCKHQLSHSSDFFRTLFLNSYALPMDGVRQVGEDEYLVQVSSLRHPPQALQFQWFLETTVPSPLLRDISDDLLETCMRLCKRFAARGLEMRCTKFLKDQVEAKPPLMALCWLNWSFKHHFHRSVQQACLPVVARLPLCQLEKHRQMMPEGVFADLLAMKLRTSYQQASTVFHTIHRMDHFHVDMAQCPRCGRQREQGRVRVQASPCHKLVGCERCMHDYQCELGEDAGAASQLQAFWQCEHGLWPFSERTEDCRCQTPLYKANLAASAGPEDAPGGSRKNSSAGGGGSRQPQPQGMMVGGGAGRFTTSSQLTLASKQPSHSSRS